MYKAISILVALAVVQASAQTCDTGAATHASSTLSNCRKSPCWLKRGETVNFSLKFTPTSVLSNPTAHVEASHKSIHRTYLNDALICGKIFRVSDNSLAPCPLSPGVEYIYRDALPVPLRPPAIRGTVQLAIKSGSTIVKCSEVAVRIR